MIEETLARHERIAFQFSGGKDSTAALLLLRPHWDRMTVYWLDSGDAFPETRRVIEAVRGLGVPWFSRIDGRVREVIERFGPPSDLVPFGHSEAAHDMMVATGPRLQDRSLCCLRSKMLPMHQAMVDDRITLLIRGQKNADRFKGPHRSGDVVDGIELLYPIENWSDGRVLDYLRAEMPDVLPLYQWLDKSGDCMSCSAWLGDRRGEYLAQRHPVAFAEYRRRLDLIAGACAPVVGRIYQSVTVAHGDTNQEEI
jgi:phosphoadenosine phosphosulfate reductase